MRFLPLNMDARNSWVEPQDISPKPWRISLKVGAQRISLGGGILYNLLLNYRIPLQLTKEMRFAIFFEKPWRISLKVGEFLCFIKYVVLKAKSLCFFIKLLFKG